MYFWRYPSIHSGLKDTEKDMSNANEGKSLNLYPQHQG